MTETPKTDWLEQVWMEAADEIAYETRHPQSWPCLWPECVGDPQTACHGRTEPCK